MRIKLTANSNVSLPAHLAAINVNYGYSINTINNLISDNDWQIKVASTIDKVFSLFKPLSIEQKEFITSVTESAQFLEKSIPIEDSHIDDFTIQLYIKTPLNDSIKKISNLLAKNSKGDIKKIFTGLAGAIDEHAGFMGSQLKTIGSRKGTIEHQENLMLLGTEFFKQNDNHLSYCLEESIGLKRMTNLLVYHEASHAFDITNTRKFGNKFSQVFDDIYENSKLMAFNDNQRNYVDGLIENHPDSGYDKINQKYSQEIASLFREIYADVGSVLLQRNQDIIENKYSKENDLITLNSLISARNNEDYTVKKSVNDFAYVSEFNHFSSPGLEYIKDVYATLPIKVLNQEEIHTIAHKAIEQGVSRILIASSVSNEHNRKELTTLFSIQKEIKQGKDGSYLDLNLYAKSDINLYNNHMEELTQYAGKEWVKEFYKNVHTIFSEKLPNPKKLVWNAAFHNTQYQKDLNIHQELETSHSTMSPQNPIENKSNLGVKNKGFVEANVDKLVDRLRRSSNEQSKNFKPNSP